MAYAFSLKLLKIRKLHICKVVFMYVRVMKLKRIMERENALYYCSLG